MVWGFSFKYLATSSMFIISSTPYFLLMVNVIVVSVFALTPLDTLFMSFNNKNSLRIVH